MENTQVYSQLDRVIKSANTVILGKENEIKLALACLVAGGHLLIEDLPGVGKTTLAHTLANLLGLEFNRVQFTSDMLPADVLGISVFEPNTSSFTFHPGPIFSNVVLADEINRATPKTQSALLEAMEEHQVTLEGTTRQLPQPFFVIATQNPGEQIGTYPLPESQLDRFLMSISLGYPNKDAERQLLSTAPGRKDVSQLDACTSPADLLSIQQTIKTAVVSEALLDYLQSILNYSRQSGLFAFGLSPRAGLGLLHVARAWAIINHRDYVIPEDIQDVLPSVVNHRLVSVEPDEKKAAEYILSQVAIP